MKTALDFSRNPALLAGACPPASPAATHSGGLAVPVTGCFLSSPEPGPLSLFGNGAFAGTFSVATLEVQDGEVVAVGRLVGALRDRSGSVLLTIARANVAMRVTVAGKAGPKANQRVPTLPVELGPLDLDLFGLRIHLARCGLEISASSQPEDDHSF